MDPIDPTATVVLLDSTPAVTIVTSTADASAPVIVPDPPELVELRAKVADLTAQLAGADAARAAALLERDAARLALDASDYEPCTLCGKQRKDRP